MAEVVETSTNTNSVTVIEENRSVSVTNTSVNVVSVNNLAIPTGAGRTAASISCVPTGSVSSLNVQAAIAELARQQYSQDAEPTDVEEGTFWYETDTDKLFVYQEVAPGTFEWRPVIISTVEDDQVVDAGSY